MAGHAIAIRFYFKPELAYVTWLTQVVVDQKHRSKGIAYRLCSLACDPKDCFAYGLATSNPFTVKSLEKACGMKVNCSKVIAYGDVILQSCEIPHLRSAKTRFQEDRIVADTQFFVSHDKTDLIISRSTDWNYGTLQEGEEFIAICFPENRKQRKSVPFIADPFIRTMVMVPVAMCLIAFLKELAK
jgi:hypothetical protein